MYFVLVTRVSLRIAANAAPTVTPTNGECQFYMKKAPGRLTGRLSMQKLFVEFGDLGAFERQVIHQTLRAKDKPNDRILYVPGVDLFAGTEIDNCD